MLYEDIVPASLGMTAFGAKQTFAEKLTEARCQ